MIPPFKEVLAILACSAGITYLVALFLKRFEPKVQTFQTNAFIVRIEECTLEILLLSGRPRTIKNISNLDNFSKSFDLLRRKEMPVEIHWEELLFYRGKQETRINWAYIRPGTNNHTSLNIPVPVNH